MSFSVRQIDGVDGEGNVTTVTHSLSPDSVTLAWGYDVMKEDPNIYKTLDLCGYSAPRQFPDMQLPVPGAPILGLGGYYHWKVAQLGQLQACPHLQGQPVPKAPVARPSGRPHPQRSTQTGTPATGASGRHQDGGQLTSDRGGKKSTSNQGGKTSTSNQGGKTFTSNQGGKTSTSRQGGKPASTGRGEKQTTSGDLVDLPLEREGVGDGTWTDWYQRTVWGAEGGMSEPQGPPYPIRTAQARREAIGQIYNSMDGKDLPPHNIASEALQAYYSGVDPQTLKTWACQILCMISKYHMACVTRGSPVTSPILPGVIEDRLPP